MMGITKPDRALDIVVRHDGSTPVLHLAGFVDRSTAGRLALATTALTALGTPEFVVVCDDLTFADLALVNVLVEAAQRSSVSVRGLSPTARRLFHLVGHDHLVVDDPVDLSPYLG